MKERSFDDFDEFADDYRSIHTQNVKLSGADSFYFAAMKVRLLQQFEKNESLKVLDVGCGDGTTEVFMQEYFPAWQVSGIDVSGRSIEEAIKKKLPHSTFSIYDGANIPGGNGEFDIVFIAGVLHHVAFSLHSTLMKEVTRVLRPGGRLYLYEHNPLNPLTGYLVKTCVFDKEAKLLSSGYTSGLIKQCSLKETNKDFIIFFPRKGVLSKLIFLEKYLQWLPLGGQYVIRAVKQA